MPGHCPKCGTLLDNRFCHECKTKEPKKTLFIHFNNGKMKAVHNIHPELLHKFQDFRWELFIIQNTNLRENDETLYIPRNSISWFEVREVAE